MIELADPRHVRLRDWLCTAPHDRVPSTQAALADELGVHPRTLRDWKVRDDFVKSWKEHSMAVAGSPERTQRVLDALYEQALDAESGKQVQAAKTWAQIAGVIVPPEKDEKHTSGDLLSMSKDELDALLVEVLQAQGATAGTPA